MNGTIRDNRLLDALETLQRRSFENVVWRSTREGNDPTICWRSGGRWDDRTYDVLYTSINRATAIEERRFHLHQGQPLPPSKVNYELFEIEVKLSQVVNLTEKTLLQTLGLDIGGFGRASYLHREKEYPSSQQIAEACSFLGADGILVPSARTDSDNLIAFCEQEPHPSIMIKKSHGVIDWSQE